MREYRAAGVDVTTACFKAPSCAYSEATIIKLHDRSVLLDAKQTVLWQEVVKTILAGVSAIVGMLAGPIPQTYAADLPQYADFLTLPGCGGGTTFYSDPASTAAERAACRAAVKSRGYTHLYISMAHEHANWFTNPAGFRSLLQELTNDGLEPVVFLTSDAGAWKDSSVSAIKTDLSNAIPKIDKLVSSYVIGIEADEYWTEGEAPSIGTHMQKLTRKRIAVHQTSHRWDFCVNASWCDYMMLQYMEPTSPITTAEISTITQEAKADLGDKPIVGAEYHGGSESTSIPLGTAADAAGTTGFGNGGVPPPFVSAPADNARTTDRTPTFDWTDIGSTTYTLMVDNNSNFTSPVVDRSGLVGSTYSPTVPLAPGVYYWLVSAKHFGDIVGPRSAVRRITVR
jgi:hypothetical protein